MFEKAYAAIAILGIAIVTSGASLAQDAPRPQVPVLDVAGEGRVSAVPDMATIRLGVVARAADPGEAVAAMDGPMTRLLDAMADMEIDPRDVRTGELRLRPIYGDRDAPRSDGPRIEGFEAASDVEVTLRAIDRLGPVLGGGMEAGSNRFDGLSFGLRDPAPSRDAALEAAVRDARHKAQVIAEAADLRLGPIVSITEAGGFQPQGPAMMDMARESAVSVAPGTLEITARVQIRFAIQP